MTQAILSRIYSKALTGRLVFLSTSFPKAERDTRFLSTARPFAIADAVIAAARAIFGAKGGIVFGGHPTISPLILSVARDYLGDFLEGERPYVHVYQSEFFKDDVPDETKRLVQEGMGVIHTTPAVKGDREKSLELMRYNMLETQPIAGIFIGGMEGVYSEGARASEFALFKEVRKGCPVYPIGGPGGASRILLERLLGDRETMTWKYKVIDIEDLAKPRPYTLLMRNIVSDIIAHL